MITIRSKIEDRKSSRLMEIVDIMDLIPFVGNVLYITQDRALSVAQQKHGRPMTHRFRKSKYFIQVLSGSEEILLAVIKRIPFDGQAVFTNEWDLGALAYSQDTEGPYNTNLPTPKQIHQFLQFQRIDSNRKIKHKNIILSPNQILTKELRQDLKRWNELIYENVFRIESARATPKAHLPYGMFLTRLFQHVMKLYPHLDNGIYDVIERVMHPLSLRQTRRPRNDHGKARHFIFSTSAHHNRGSSSHQGDDDEDDSASPASTSSPATYLNSLKPLDYQPYEVPTSKK
ncbi:hypothetical protein Tco_1531926 [Tanacetum coccineum]